MIYCVLTHPWASTGIPYSRKVNPGIWLNTTIANNNTVVFPLCFTIFEKEGDCLHLVRRDIETPKHDMEKLWSLWKCSVWMKSAYRHGIEGIRWFWFVFVHWQYEQKALVNSWLSAFGELNKVGVLSLTLIVINKKMCSGKRMYMLHVSMCVYEPSNHTSMVSRQQHRQQTVAHLLYIIWLNSQCKTFTDALVDSWLYVFCLRNI